jgi:AraC-like DNA-binding protein/mannose-6-phosphate isomerase-like protein (cupin superfamily)
MMLSAVDRYTAADLSAPAGDILMLRQHVEDTGVHWHDFYELVLVLSGSAVHTVNGISRDLHRGNAFMLTPADFHRIVADGSSPLVCYNVVIQPTSLERHLADVVPFDAMWPDWVADDLVDVEGDFDRLWREACEPRWGSRLVMDSLLRCILVEFARRRDGSVAAGGHRRVPSSEAGMVRAVTFMEHHFREPLTLADVAARAHLSPNYFSERFGLLMGVSYQSYLQQLRLRFAEALLTTTGVSVTEASRAAGFNTPSHFGRAYRRRYGSAPSSHRQGAGPQRPSQTSEKERR